MTDHDNNHANAVAAQLRLAEENGTLPEDMDVDMAPPVEATVVDGGFECVCGATRKTPLGINRHRSMCPEARDE